MKKTAQKPNQQYLLRSIVSELKFANSEMDLEEILILIPNVIEDLLPNILSNIKLSKRTFSPFEFRLRELRMKRKRGEIKDKFENLEESDPELIISATMEALNEITDGSSIYYSIPSANSNLVPIEHQPKQLFPYATRTSSTEVEYYEIGQKYNVSKEHVGLLHRFESEVTPLNLEEEMWKPVHTSLSMLQMLQEPLQKVQAKTSKREFLTLDDILDIDHLIKSRTLQPNEVEQTISILSDDIERRNEKYDCDCIKELYRGNDSLPKSQRLIKPSKGDKLEKIKERMRAILLDEYVRLRKTVGDEFLNGKITYEEYKKTIGHYVRQVTETWPR